MYESRTYLCATYSKFLNQQTRVWFHVRLPSLSKQLVVISGTCDYSAFRMLWHMLCIYECTGLRCSVCGCRPAAESRGCGCAEFWVRAQGEAPAVMPGQWMGPGWRAQRGRGPEPPSLWSDTLPSDRIWRTHTHTQLQYYCHGKLLKSWNMDSCVVVLIFESCITSHVWLNGGSNEVSHYHSSWVVIVTVDFNLFYSCNFVMKNYVITCVLLLIIAIIFNSSNFTSWTNTQVRNDGQRLISFGQSLYTYTLCNISIILPLSVSLPYCKGSQL